jgi:hypothetical protein
MWNVHSFWNSYVPKCRAAVACELNNIMMLVPQYDWLSYRLEVWASNPHWGTRFFFSPKCPDRFWGPPNLLFTGYCGGLSLAVKWLGLEADRSLSLSAEVKHEWSCTSTHPTCLCDMYRDDVYFTITQDSSVGTVTRLRMGWSGDRISAGARNFSLYQLWSRPSVLSSRYSRTFPGVKQQGGEADHLPPSSAKVTNEWSSTSAVYICLHSIYSDSLTFTFTVMQSSIQT